MFYVSSRGGSLGLYNTEQTQFDLNDLPISSYVELCNFTQSTH